VRLLLPGELAKHAVSEGTKAVTKYTSSKWARRAHNKPKGSFKSHPPLLLRELRLLAGPILRLGVRALD
jgi:hypothetical protein